MTNKISFRQAQMAVILRKLDDWDADELAEEAAILYAQCNGVPVETVNKGTPKNGIEQHIKTLRFLTMHDVYKSARRTALILYALFLRKTPLLSYAPDVQKMVDKIRKKQLLEDNVPEPEENVDNPDNDPKLIEESV